MMKRVFLVLFVQFIIFSVFAQSNNFKLFLNKFEKELSLSIDSVHLLTNSETINNSLINNIVFVQQEERGKFYTKDNRLVSVTTYNKFPENPTNWTDIDGNEYSVMPHIFSLGHLKLNSKYHILLVKLVDPFYSYIDAYCFNKLGKLMSVVNLYESQEDVIYQVSSILLDGTIKRNEKRYGVTIDKNYKLQDDGYFKVTYLKKEGEFEY